MDNPGMIKVMPWSEDVQWHNRNYTVTFSEDVVFIKATFWLQTTCDKKRNQNESKKTILELFMRITGNYNKVRNERCRFTLNEMTDFIVNSIIRLKT